MNKKNKEKKERGFTILGLLGWVSAALVGYLFLEKVSPEFLNALLKFGGTILNAIGKAAFNMAANLLTHVISNYTNITIIGDKTFSEVWTRVRDLANMIIVLGFVIVGVATALRIQEYQAKKILWRLILVAIFINFSGLFCGLFIDAANLTMKGLGLENAGGNFKAIQTAVNNYFDAALRITK